MLHELDVSRAKSLDLSLLIVCIIYVLIS
jgi:hypothetical protein